MSLVRSRGTFRPRAADECAFISIFTWSIRKGTSDARPTVGGSVGLPLVAVVLEADREVTPWRDANQPRAAA